MNCPACGAANPEGSRFCNACGNRLDQSAAGGDLDPFLPRELLAKLEAARAGRAMEGERRVVTMLFCDVKGSTAMAETMDPEDWTEIMNGAFERLIAPVYRYEGTLARLMGDAIFAFFGAPIAHEDDPQRAVRAGLDILSGIDGYKRQVRESHGLELDVRVGIHTGTVMVGQVGSDLRLEYTAMGDAVNVAARMEQTAEPGTVQITAETYKLVAPLFDVESRGGIEVKGKTEPVDAYRVLRGAAEPRAIRAMDRAPLVGRARELDTLFAAVSDAVDGRGRIVSIVGEAGLGKSRLVRETRAEWARRAPEDPPTDGGGIHRLWETWQCVSFDTTRPYAQYQRTVANLADIQDIDPPEVVRSKLAATIEGGDRWMDPHMRVFASLFGVTAPGEERLEGEAFRDAIMHLVPASTREIAGGAPRLLVCEDLHWCDEASLEVLMETATLVDDLPFLFVFTYRPDRDAGSWRLKQWLETEYPHRSTEVVLAPLSAEESGRLIDALIPGEDTEHRRQILERTDGNPLFVEEVVATLQEHHDDLAIPTTLQALFTTRLDALDQAARHTLQLASVIGRSFTEPVLRVVAGDDRLPDSLRTLERLGLIEETARTPERRYAFRHSLTQDATYGTILLRRRRELHQRVGEVFEELYADRIEEFAALLAQHFREAGDDERTLRYATMAAETASRLYANVEAAAHWGLAIETARRLGRDDVALADLYPRRGRTLELSGRFQEAVTNYEHMESLARERDIPATALAAEMALTTLYVTPTPVFDGTRGRVLADRSIAHAQKLGDRAAEAKALWNLMILSVYGNGDPAGAIEAGERSLEIARELGNREQIAFALTDLWRPYATLGDLSASRARLDEARPVWREIGNVPMLCESLSSTAALLRLAGENDEALALCDESYALAHEIGNDWGQSYSLLNAYNIDIDRGDLGTAIDKIHRCIEHGSLAGFVVPQAIARGDEGVLMANLGALDRGRALVDEALEVAKRGNTMAVPIVTASVAEVQLRTGDIAAAAATIGEGTIVPLPGPIHFAAEAHVELLRGRVALLRGDAAAALANADAMIEWLARIGIEPFLPEALLLKGDALRASGAATDAEAVLREARSKASRLGFAIVWRIDAALGELVAQRGAASLARELAAEARVTVERVAASLDDDDLRRSFLAVPEVHAVMKGGTLAP